MFIVLGFSAVRLAAAGRVFLQATPERLALVRSMTLAQVFSIVCGVATNLTAVCWHVVPEDGKPIDFHAMVWGVGEALTPAGLGFPLLAATWLLVAIGVRRAHDPAV